MTVHNNSNSLVLYSFKETSKMLDNKLMTNLKILHQYLKYIRKYLIHLQCYFQVNYTFINKRIIRITNNSRKDHIPPTTSYNKT
jgi:hypothetical protein